MRHKFSEPKDILFSLLISFFVVPPPLSAAALKQLGKEEEEEERKGKGRFGVDCVGGGAPSSSSCVIWATLRNVQTNSPRGREGGVSHYTLWVFDRLDGICLDKS